MYDRLKQQHYTSVQVQQLKLDGPTVGSITANAADARVWGAELENRVAITENLSAGVTFSWLDFKYANFEPGTDPATLRIIAGQNRPKLKYAINSKYQLPVGRDFGNISLSADWAWQAEALVSAGVDPAARQSAYGLLNLSSNWDDVMGLPIDASVFVVNATNRIYKTGGVPIINILGFSDLTYGAPRIWGLRLRYRFGE